MEVRGLSRLDEKPTKGDIDLDAEEEIVKPAEPVKKNTKNL